MLVRAGVRRSTALLAVALLFGAVRLGGHALVNVNDFPMAMLSLLVMLYLWIKLREDHLSRPLREGIWPRAPPGASPGRRWCGWGPCRWCRR